MIKITFIACLSWCLVTALAANDVNILDYGAVADGKTLNSSAIQEAIDDCAAQGGGTVVVPAGQFLTGTIYLKSKVYLHLDAGAVLLGSTDIADYPENTPEHVFYRHDILKHSLIYAENQSDFGITGYGTIDGQGSAFVVTTKKKPDRYKNRPYIIWMVTCKDVLIEDVTLQNSAYWMQHYMVCDNLTVRGIKVFNHCNQNNDMIDLDGCKNVIISDCYGDTDDDALTFKSLSGKITENVTVTNCILSSHCNAIKCGTESSGGFRNIVISNCIIRPSADPEPIFGFPEGIGGIALELVDGGVMDGIIISDIIIEGTEVPLFIRLGNRARKYQESQPDPGVGQLRKVSISNIRAKVNGTIGCSVSGLPGHPVEQISLNNISIEYPGGASTVVPLSEVPEKEDAYPESTMFGTLPAYGLFIRHARDIQLNGLVFKLQQADVRPALVLDDTERIRINNLSIEGHKERQAVIHARNSKGVVVAGVSGIDDPGKFFSKEGENNTDIKLISK